MEEKHLNYNQPILSVRRFTSAVTSEKNDKTKTNRKLPNKSSLPYYKSDLKSGPVSNPGNIPFMWEKSPGRPKYETESPSNSLEQPPMVPKLPPGRIIKVKDQGVHKASESSSPRSCEGRVFGSSSHSISSLDEITAKFESPKDEIEEKQSSSSEDNEEAYQDALDTLSRTESFFLNCSLSGVSESDDPQVKCSGTFSTDPQMRDYMMGKFLPAAKAMTCDLPQTAYKKPVAAKEQPQKLKDLIGGNQKPLVNRSRANIVPNYAEVYREEESEDDDDDDYDNRGNLSTKVCGLLPRFCLMSPVPGVSMRTRAPMSSVSRKKVGSSSAASVQETKKEVTGLATQEQRPIDRSWNPEFCEYNQSTISKSNQVPYENNNQKLDGNSLYRRLQGSCMSSHENKLPQSRFYREAEIVEIDSFNSAKRCADTFEELSGHRRTEKAMDFVVSIVEKTLYVDSVHKVSPEIKSVSLDRKGLEDATNNGIEISEEKCVDVTPLVDTVCKNNENPKVTEEHSISHHKSVDACNSELPSANSRMSRNEHLNTEVQQKLIDLESTRKSSEFDTQYLIPPPLPKSPTESWLWRTLPSVPSKNSVSRPYLGDKMNFQNRASKAPSGDLKWETIVKTTKVQHQHTRFSEELSTAASKT